MTNLRINEEKVYISPFSVTSEIELKWQTMTGKEQPKRNGMLNVPDGLMQLIQDLEIVGVIGSVQLKRLYLRTDAKKHISKAIDFGLLKQHTLIRDGREIPLFTLGATGMALAGLDHNELANYWKVFNKEEVLQRMVFYQLYGQFKSLDSKVEIRKVEEPFVGGIEIQGMLFHILVIRGNESLIKNYFKYEMTNDKRILMVSENLNQTIPIQNEIKPFLQSIRLTTDERLKLPFDDMFYEFRENNWVLENEQ